MPQDHLIRRNRAESDEMRDLEDAILRETGMMESADFAESADYVDVKEDHQTSPKGNGGRRTLKPARGFNSGIDSDDEDLPVRRGRVASSVRMNSSSRRPEDDDGHNSFDEDSGVEATSSPAKKVDVSHEQGGGGGSGSMMAEDIMMEDLDDLDMDFEDAPAASAATTVSSEPVDEQTCIGLREIVFGRATGRGFPDVWLEQGFVFNDSKDRPGQEFGLVQHKGGPCGPIAAVQAHVLQHLLPNTRHKKSPLKTDTTNWSTVSPNVVGDVLVEALTTILVSFNGTCLDSFCGEDKILIRKLPSFFISVVLSLTCDSRIV